MVVSNPLAHETIWFDKWRCDDAERIFHEQLAHDGNIPSLQSGSSLASEIARAREQIQKSLKTDEMKPIMEKTVNSRIEKLEEENSELRKATEDLKQLVKNLENRIISLEKGGSTAPTKGTSATEKKDESGTEEDFELFESDEEEADEEAERLKQERVAAYTAKKANKKQIIAKSNIILDVKPWDDETDMKVIEECVRSVTLDGLFWGAAKLVPVGYGIKKLQITCVVEDDKVSVDDLEERITAFEEHVQSVDIAAFNKI